MGVNKMANSLIIEEIYEAKREEDEIDIDRKYKEKRSISVINDTLDAIQSLCRKNITKETKDIIIEYCKQLDRAIGEEIDFSQKVFYKYGFIDGMRMYEELKKDT